MSTRAPFETALTDELAGGEVVADTIEEKPCVFLRGLYLAERGVADRLRSLRGGAPPWPDDRRRQGRSMGREEDRQDAGGVAARRDRHGAASPRWRWSPAAPASARRRCSTPSCAFSPPRERKILLAAPTGRAAKRMTEQTGIEAKTIHRLLEIDPKTGGFRRDADNPLDCDLLVIDETSMVDALAHVRAVEGGSDEGRAAAGRRRRPASLGRSGSSSRRHHRLRRVPVARLTEVFRQAAESRIVVERPPHQSWRNAGMAEAGRGLGFLLRRGERRRRKARPRSSRSFATEFRAASASIPFATCRCSAPCSAALSARERSTPICRTRSIRTWPRRSSASARSSRPATRSCRPRTTTTARCSTATSAEFAASTRPKASSSPSFDGREVEYPFGELDALVPAYATTIHKSQGSEYPAVVITLATQHYTMLARNLVYTAVTRGKRLVVIVGQRKALAIAVRTHGRKRRWTKLKEWLSPR